jgi:hypothetical protein
MAEMKLRAVLPSVIPVHVDSALTPRGVTQPYPVITGLDEFAEGIRTKTTDYENNREVILTKMPFTK